MHLTEETTTVPERQSSDAPRHIFTYGSLMFPAVWNGVVRGRYRSAGGTVHGFRRLAVRGEEHPALAIAPGAPPIRGVVYFDIGSDDVARLDHFETTEYARVAVAVTIDGTAIAADAYLALNVDALLDQDWDVAAFERDGLQRFLARYAVVNAPDA